MAAALSRALKLPGKKSSELGEYDPLTQADSEDESEEDDLVVNYPRNGLGRGSCMGAGTTDLRGGRAGRLVDDEDEVEEDEEEWTERRPSKTRQEREELKARQYWSQREGGRDGGGEDGGGQGAGGSVGLGLGSGSDSEEKRARVRGAIRTAFFLVPLCCAILLVLLCAFLLPCKQGDLDKRPQWVRELGEAGGVNLPSVALWDVDNDTIEDVLIGVTQQINNSQLAGAEGYSKEHTVPEYSVVAISAISGENLWKTGVKEPVKSIQCGLQPQARPAAPLRTYLQGSVGQVGATPTGRSRGSVCLFIGSTHFTAVSGTTGKKLWSVAPGKIVSQAVSVPDLNGDSVSDFLIATLPADQVSDLSLLLLSGVSGTQIGHSVTFNLTAQGKLIGPELHVTGQGAYYILFGLGTVEAVSLKDIYTQATGRAPMSPMLKVKDSSWEKLRRTNSSLIHISSGSEQVEFLVPLVTDLCNNHNNFDSVSNLNASRSDWVLVCGSSKLSVLRERDAHTQWTVNSAAIHGRPAPGHFNDDGIPDLLIQQSISPGVRKVQVIDGASGRGLWEADFVCPQLELEGSSLMTTSGLSVFLFWAGDIQTLKNLTKATASQGVPPANPVLNRLYLLHPAYPTVLMELTTTTDHVLIAAVSYQEQQKDASYITISARPTSKPEAQVVRSLSLRASITGGRILRLGEDRRAGGSARPGAFEINKFFRHLSFRQHQ